MRFDTWAFSYRESKGSGLWLYFSTFHLHLCLCKKKGLSFPLQEELNMKSLFSLHIADLIALIVIVSPKWGFDIIIFCIMLPNQDLYIKMWQIQQVYKAVYNETKRQKGMEIGFEVGSSLTSLSHISLSSQVASWKGDSFPQCFPYSELDCVNRLNKLMT